jgi:predicted transcriptional regulator
MRENVFIKESEYVIISESKRRLVLEKLEGDFSDYRKRLGISQVAMAELLGISQAFLSKVENGMASTPPHLVSKAERMLVDANKKSRKKAS